MKQEDSTIFQNKKIKSNNHGLQFEKSDLVEYLEKCPICGSTDRSRIVTSRLKTIRYLRCNNCQVVSTSHYVNDDLLKKIYSSYYSTNKSHKGEVTHDNPGLLAKHISSYLSFADTKVCILDYGGGSGLISYQIALSLVKKGNVKTVDILVVDFNEEKSVVCDDSRISIQRMSPVIFLNEHKKEFDLIVASAVFEHIFFPGSLIVELFNRIKVNGFIYIRVPYMIPLYKFLLKFGIEIENYFPEHFHDFSKKSLENLPGTFHLKNLEIVVSQPSFFEYSFSKHFLLALCSRIIRAPYKLNKNYPFVGGWEIIYGCSKKL